MARQGYFAAHYDQYRERDGQHFTLVRVIDKADDDHDEEVLPMYAIRFDDGTEIEAWPEEVRGMVPAASH